MLATPKVFQGTAVFVFRKADNGHNNKNHVRDMWAGFRTQLTHPARIPRVTNLPIVSPALAGPLWLIAENAAYILCPINGPLPDKIEHEIIGAHTEVPLYQALSLIHI